MAGIVTKQGNLPSCRPMKTDEYNTVRIANIRFVDVVTVADSAVFASGCMRMR